MIERERMRCAAVSNLGAPDDRETDTAKERDKYRQGKDQIWMITGGAGDRKRYRHKERTRQ